MDVLASVTFLLWAHQEWEHPRMFGEEARKVDSRGSHVMLLLWSFGLFTRPTACFPLAAALSVKGQGLGLVPSGAGCRVPGTRPVGF